MVSATVVLCEPLMPATLKLNGLVSAAVKLLTVNVLVWPARIVAGEKLQVKDAGHPRVILPVKLLGDVAVMGKVTEALPARIVEVDAEDESVKTATPIPERATV